jgi:5-methylcytosine-specific restriction protein A
MPQSPSRYQQPSGVTIKPATRIADRFRGSACKRGYDRAWQKVRAVHLQREPLCRFCFEQGTLRPADVVDHVQTINERPDLRLDRANLRSLCKPCHDARTAREQAFGKTKPKRSR